MTEHATTRVVRCRMTNRYGDPCGGEALDPNGDVLICMRHAALVIEMIRVKAGKRTARSGR